MDSLLCFIMYLFCEKWNFVFKENSLLVIARKSTAHMQKEQDVCPPNRSHIHLSQSSTKLTELNSNHSRFHFDSETELLESQSSQWKLD